MNFCPRSVIKRRLSMQLSLFAIAQYEHEIEMRINVVVVSNACNDALMTDVSRSSRVGICKRQSVIRSNVFISCSHHYEIASNNFVRGSQIPSTETTVHPPPCIPRCDFKQNSTHLQPLTSLSNIATHIPKP